jgi:hypothetical protein
VRLPCVGVILSVIRNLASHTPQRNNTSSSYLRVMCCVHDAYLEVTIWVLTERSQLASSSCTEIIASRSLLLRKRGQIDNSPCSKARAVESVNVISLRRHSRCHDTVHATMTLNRMCAGGVTLSVHTSTGTPKPRIHFTVEYKPLAYTSRRQPYRRVRHA